jgi:hypothetical protein
MLVALAPLALGKERMPRYWLWLLGADLAAQMLASFPCWRSHFLPLFLFPWVNDLPWVILAVLRAVVDARPAIAAGVSAALGRAISFATARTNTQFGHVFFWPLACVIGLIIWPRIDDER